MMRFRWEPVCPLKSVCPCSTKVKALFDLRNGVSAVLDDKNSRNPS